MKYTESSKIGAIAALAVLVASCGGGGGVSGSLPRTAQTAAPQLGSSPSPQPSQAPAVNATASFTIAVPPAIATSASSARHPMYVSPNTNSVAITLNAVNGKSTPGAPVVTKIGYGQPGCTASASQPLSCTVSMAVPSQAYDTLTVATYSSQNGSGTPLSQTTLTQTFAANQTTNVPLSLGGVVASVAMSPSVINTVQGAARTEYILSVTAKDASGAVILGTTPFQSPISVAVQGDANGALSISQNTITGPGIPLQVYYDGTKTLSQGQVVASAGLMGTATTTVIPLSFSPGSKTIQMGSGAQSISVSEAQFTGQFTATVDLPQIATANVVSTGPGTATVNIVPAALGGKAGTANVTISDGSRSATLPVKVTLPSLPGITYDGPFTSFSPVQMTLAPSGKIYMTSNPNMIAEFDPSTATVTNHSLAAVGYGVALGITVDGSGNVWIAKNNFPTPTFCEMTIPSYAIACYNTGVPTFAHINELTFATDGGIWFTDSGTPAIGRFDPVTHAIVEYTNGLAPGANPYGIVDGHDGNLYFSDTGGTPAFGIVNMSSGTIAEYSAGLAGYNPQAQTSSTPYFIVRGADGNIWAADPGEETIDKFVPSQRSTTQYGGGIQQYGNPWAITSAPDGSLWFTDAGFFAPAALGHVQTANGFTQEYVGFPSQATFSINGIVVTSPHDIWFLDQNAHSMGHVSI